MLNRFTGLSSLYKVFSIQFLTVFISPPSMAQAFVDFQWAGAVTPTSAVVKAKVIGDMTVRLALSPDSSFSAPIF